MLPQNDPCKPANHRAANSKNMEREMNKLFTLVAKIVREEHGQDLVEYALLAGFIAVAAGALLPGISTSISTIFSRMASVLSNAAA
jgi:pilus assembly protein Flp/PilA